MESYMRNTTNDTDNSKVHTFWRKVLQNINCSIAEGNLTSPHELLKDSSIPLIEKKAWKQDISTDLWT